MADLLFRSRIIVVDTETSGFHQDWSRVVDLAAVVVEPDGTISERFESLICPDIFDAEQAKGAIAIHGITPEMVRGQPNTYMVARTFLGWVQTHGLRWATSFNTGFDGPHLDRMSIKLSWASCIMEKATKPMAAADALPLLRGGKPKWPKLSEAGDFFGIPEQGTAHRALPDALRAAGIMVAIRRRELGGAS